MLLSGVAALDLKGAAQIYQQVVLPYLTRYEGEIDYHLNK